MKFVFLSFALVLHQFLIWMLLTLLRLVWSFNRILLLMLLLLLLHQFYLLVFFINRPFIGLCLWPRSNACGYASGFFRYLFSFPNYLNRWVLWIVAQLMFLVFFPDVVFRIKLELLTFLHHFKIFSCVFSNRLRLISKHFFSKVR